MRTTQSGVSFFNFEVSSAAKYAIALAVSFASALAAAAPPDHPDPALQRWYESLREPRHGYSCCTAADCRTTHARRGPKGWEVLVDERFRASTQFWIPVPPEKTLSVDNPTGQAVACYLPEAGLICFVPAPES